MIFSNLLIYNNESWTDIDWPVLISSNAISIGGRRNVLINNATIINNSQNEGIQGGPIYMHGRNSTVHLYNSIIYNNNPNNLYYKMENLLVAAFISIEWLLEQLPIQKEWF